MPDLFVVFEGIDGSGKSTQVRMLHSALLSRLDGQVEVCRDPGGTLLGESVRKILLGGDSRIGPAAEALLYAACRAQLVDELIRPALKQGKVVICDRFSDSAFAYQGFGRGLSFEFLERLDELATGGLKPDLTVLLDLPSGLVSARLAKKADRIEKEGPAFFERVRKGYLFLAEKGGSRYLVLDARLPAAELHQRILRRVESLL